MKTFIYSSLVCFALSCMQGNAQPLTKIYDGKESPAEAGWTELKLDKTVNDATTAEATQEVAGGVLKLRSANAADQFSQLGWYKTDLGLNLGTGYTIEIKAKISDASQYGAFNIQGFDNTGRGFRIGIYKNSVAESTNPLAATNVLETGLSNDDEFHIYRIAVAPTGMATLYRDSEEIGTFPVSVFMFDNLITNGGFEDGGDDFDNAAFFPDFRSNALLFRTDEPDIDKPAAGYVDVNFVKSGKYALITNSDGKRETGNPDEYNPETSERARTREIPVKPDTKYDISFSRSRIINEPHDWRDIGVFYDFHEGTLTGQDKRGDNALWTGANDPRWETHNQTITTPKEDAERVAASMRFEFPSWWKDGAKAVTAFDDFYVKENLGLIVGQEVAGWADPVFPDNIDEINLIINGGFEDWHTNHDGTPYEWALSNPENADSNEPAAFNPLWNGLVRIQRSPKPDEGFNEAKDWARSGESSLRISTLGNPDNRTFAFTKELEAGKSYRFNFWHRSAQWWETAWTKVKIGDKVIWGSELGGNRNNAWANVDLTFTTTAENKTLCLYIDDYVADWYNLYLDDLVLYEIPSLEDPQLAGKTNLIANGDFEDGMLGNDGQPYMWALASDYDGGDFPVMWSDVWGTYVRLQDKQKGHDSGLDWARSGNNSLRMSFLGDQGAAIENEVPDAYQSNMNFRKELEPNKTYTFVFWIKVANWDNWGDLMVANGDILLWKETLSKKHINWSRQSVTFTTTEKDYTLRMYTNWTGWMNFYLDDIFLYEEETYIPLAADNTYLFFGKSMGTQSADVDIEYVAINNTGAYAPEPTGIKQTIAAPANLKVNSLDGKLTFKALSPATVKVYAVTGLQVAQLNVEKEASIALPQGIYIVKSVSTGIIETVKVVNK